MRYGPYIVAALLLIPACGGDDEEGTPAARAAARRTTEAPRPTVPEAQIVDVLRAIDSTRVAIGVAVRDRSQSESVLEYARVMRIDHRAMSRLLDSLLVAANQTGGQSQAGLELRTKGDTAIARLIAVDTGFNNRYIAHEIADHELAVALIDTLFLRSAKSAPLKTALEQLRPTYAAHLQMAREIQAARVAAASRTGGTGVSTTAPSSTPVPADTPRTRTDTTRLPPITSTSN